MVPNDNRKTNLTVDNTLLVKGRLVANEIDVNLLRVRNEEIDSSGTSGGGSFNLNDLKANSIETKELKITSGATSNVLFTIDPSQVTAGMIPQFTTNGRTEVVPVFVSAMCSSNAYFFLDGSDGNQTISAPTTLTRDFYYDTLTIDPGAVIDMAGWTIYCKTALIHNGVFRVNGGDGGAAAGAVPGAAGLASAATGPLFPGNDGKIGAAVNTNGVAATPTNDKTIFGGLGGTGGNSDTKTGGVATQALNFFNPATIIKSAQFFTNLQFSTQFGNLLLGGVAGGGR